MRNTGGRYSGPSTFEKYMLLFLVVMCHVGRFLSTLKKIRSQRYSALKERDCARLAVCTVCCEIMDNMRLLWQ